MSDVSMMGPAVSAFTWQRPGDTPILDGMVGRLLDLTAVGWAAKFASGVGSERSLDSDQWVSADRQSGMLVPSPRGRGDLILKSSMESAGYQRGPEPGSVLFDQQSAATISSELAQLQARAFDEPKLHNVARTLTPAEKQALDEYVSQGKPSEKRAEAAERIARFIGTDGSALSLDDLGLTQLPDIVKTLRLDTLNVSGNKLTELPLPAEVAFLHVSHNALTAMPVLPEGTRMVFAADNRIREFQGPLPDTLSHVYAPNNMLDALPRFPASLVEFDIKGNTGSLTQADADAKLCSPVGVQMVHIRA